MIRTMTTLLIAGLLAAGLTACGDDDPVDPGVVPTDEPLRLTGLQVTGFGLALADVLPRWWDGDLVGPAKADPVWDGESMRWIVPLEYRDPAYTHPNSAGVAATARVQYLAEGIPQQDAAGATLMDIELDLAVFHAVYQDENDNATLTGDFVADARVVPSATEEFDFSGGASGDIHVSRTTGGEPDDAYLEGVSIDWVLGVPTDGCPSGSIAVAEDLRIFSISLDGTTTATWSYAPGDQSSVDGEMEIDCGS